MSPGTSLNWTLISAFLEFNAFPAFSMNGTPAKNGVDSENREREYSTSTNLNFSGYYTFPSFIVYTQNHSWKSGSVWVVRNSWIISIPIILSKNNFIIINWKYRLKNLHFDSFIIKMYNKELMELTVHIMKVHLLYTKNTFQIDSFSSVNQLTNK